MRYPRDFGTQRLVRMEESPGQLQSGTATCPRAGMSGEVGVDQLLPHQDTRAGSSSAALFTSGQDFTNRSSLTFWAVSQ